MISTILTASVVLNAIITGMIVITLGIIFLLERKLLKREESLKKTLIILIFIASFILLIAGIIGIMFIWNYDFSTYIQDMSGSILTFIEDSVGRIITTLLVIFVSLSIMKISKVTLNQVGKKEGPFKKRKRTIAKVTNSIIKYILGLLMILIVLSIWGVNVVPALAGLGILGLVIGLGAQKFINDLISGFFIIFEHHFDVGDIIDVQGFKGEVTSIGLKTTKVRNWKGEVKIVNNGEISTLINYSINPSVAIVDFGIAYKEDIKKTTDILNLELPKMRLEFPNIIEDPKVIGVINLAGSSVDLRVIAKTVNEQHYAIERAIRQRIKEILNEHNIEIPFPQIVIHQED
ncbi:MAG: mechanosensitive ion channel family protein [Bacillota bacterium]|nr:MAG: mechanosensitive ion channel family protein [Bacillota bacterium]